MSLGLVNLAIFVLFVYLCYCSWRDLAVKDETPHRRDQLTGLLEGGHVGAKSTRATSALFQYIINRIVHTKTSDQEEELKTLLDNAEDSIGIDGDLESFEIATHGDIEEGTQSNDFPVETEDGAATTSPSAAGASEARFTEEHKAKARELFTRSDLDASGTLNSDDEAKQLLTFILYKLTDVVGEGMTPEVLEKKTKELIDTDLEANPLDFETFWEWFMENFGEGSSGVAR